MSGDENSDRWQRFRLWLAWKIAPFSPRTVDTTLQNLEGCREVGTYDSAYELRSLMGFCESRHFGAERDVDTGSSQSASESEE